jgi:hypothetical protein
MNDGGKINNGNNLSKCLLSPAEIFCYVTFVEGFLYYNDVQSQSKTIQISRD